MWSTELEVGRAAARAAGEVLKRHARNGVKMRNKAVANLVSDADLEAEQAIVRVIRDRFPPHQILGEEAEKGDTSAEHLWIVDPLDGTANFAHGIPHFAVSIAYQNAGQVVCGIVYNPITEDWYVAERGQGAFHGETRAVVSAESELNETMIAFGLPYERGPIMQATLDATAEFVRRECHGARRMGTASLDLCYVGMGRFGAYFEYVLSPWDYAAGRLFVEEAGGLVTDCRGGALTLSKTSILATNSRLHKQSLEITSSYFPADHVDH